MSGQKPAARGQQRIRGCGCFLRTVRRVFVTNLALVLVLNLLVKPFYILGIDAAVQGRVPAQKDQLFILGLFSMLELLMGQPMSVILAQTRLPEPVHAALLDQPSPYRDALLLAIAAEGLSPDECEQQAEICGLSAMQVSLFAVEALTWANEVTAMNEG